jgi:hypothetical protein
MLLVNGCPKATVTTPESMMKVSNIVEVRIESEGRYEKVASQLKSIVEDRMRKRGYEIGGSLDNWRLDVDLLEIDTTKLQNQKRLVVELRIRAIGPRGEEYFKHNYAEVTPRIATPEGAVLETHLPPLADAIVSHVP